MSLESGAIKEEDIDKLVLGWLKKRKLDQALNVLELELKVKGQDAATAEGEAVWLRNQKEAITSFLHASLEETTENPYINQFLQFFKWADGSLDAYRPELMRLLYLTMVYTYLHLVSLSEGPLATSMLTDCKTIFLTGLPPAHKKTRESELSELSSITTPEQLETSNLAKAVRSKRAPLRLSQQAYNLFLHFLRQNELTLMLALVNQWIDITVVDGAVTTTAAEEGGLLAGMIGIGVDGSAINQMHIDIRLLKDSAVQKHVESKAIKDEEEAAAKAETDTATKKQKTALVKAAEQAKQRKDRICANSISSHIPLLSLPEERHVLLMEDLKIAETAGAGGNPVSATALPSSAFFTFVNTKQSLNCVAVSSAADAIVAGYSDSTVRMYDLKKMNSSSSGDGGDAAHQDNTNTTDDRTTTTSSSSSSCTILSGHTAAVHAVDYSPDDQLIISSSADGTARLWSSEYSMCIAAYRGHMLPVWDVAFSPEYSPYFATGGADRAARVWTTERSHALRIFCGHKGDVDVVRWHPNCQYIATGSSDTTVRLWDVKVGGCVRVFEGHTTPITSMAFSTDGSTLATGDSSGAINVWDLASAQLLAACKAHQGPVWSLSYSHGEGKVLASGGNDCTVKLWSEHKSIPAGGDNASSVDGLTRLTTWYTKKTPVVMTSFTRRDLLFAAGALSIA